MEDPPVGSRRAEQRDGLIRRALEGVTAGVEWLSMFADKQPAKLARSDIDKHETEAIPLSVFLSL
jgi:hypothetical protein